MTRLLPRQWFGESQGFLAGTFSLINGKGGCFTPYLRGERMKGMVSLPWANCFEAARRPSLAPCISSALYHLFSTLSDYPLFNFF